jgi:hypothetical protein
VTGTNGDTGKRDPFVWHVWIVLTVSAVYESLFVGHGLNVVDEGWPLYTAMRLHEGGVLYDDVFFVFPPGHVLVAWLAYALDPPGVVLARTLYAGVSVALSLGIYGLGRRVMRPSFALVGALLLAVGATSAHMQQLVFGYRYLVVSLLAILAFSQYLRGRDPRWMFAAGLMTGVALLFRLTPAFAAGCAIGVGVLAAGGAVRTWLRDWGLYGLGIALVVAPVLAWFLVSVGPEKLWLEVVVRPVAMTDQQSLPMPDLSGWPEGAARKQISDWFVGIQFRAWTLLYVGYAGALGALWARALFARRTFAYPLLTVVVVWGGVYFLRSFGRSDSAHLYSAIPPVCLLLGHLASVLVPPSAAKPAAWRRPALAAFAAAALGLWIFLMGSDRALDPRYRGDAPLEALDRRVELRAKSPLRSIDRIVKQIRSRSQPGDTILDLSASSLFHVLTGRLGPGHADIVMPGTFLSEAEEREFLGRLVRKPPAVVIYPGKDFDDMPERAVARTAPLVTRWVFRNYRRVPGGGRFIIMVPAGSSGSR